MSVAPVNDDMNIIGRAVAALLCGVADREPLLTACGRVRLYPPTTPGGYWRLKWHEHGLPQDTTGGKTLRSANEKADSIIRDLDRKLGPKANVRVEAALEAYVVFVETTHSKKAGDSDGRGRGRLGGRGCGPPRGDCRRTGRPGRSPTSASTNSGSLPPSDTGSSTALLRNGENGTVRGPGRPVRWPLPERGGWSVAGRPFRGPTT